MSLAPALVPVGSEERGLEAIAELRRQVSATIRNAGTIGAGSLNGSHLAAATITAGHLTAGSVTAGAIAAGSVTTEALTAGSVTTAILAAGAVTAEKIQADSINATHLTANSVTATELAAGSVTATAIAAGAITTAKLDAGAITTDKLAANSVTTAILAAGAVTTTTIAAGAITTAHMSAGTINANRLTAGSITATELAADSVNADKIVTGAVTSDKVSVVSLSALSTNMGALTSGSITGAVVQTGSSGARVVLNSGGITAYGLDGVTPVLTFSNSTGNLSLAGTVTANATSILPVKALQGSITGDNLLANSKVDRTAGPGLTNSFWRQSGGSVTIVNPGANGAYVGANVLQLAALDALNIVDNGGNGGIGVDVVQGETYTFSFFARTVNGGGTGQARIIWLNASNAQVGSTFTGPVTPLTANYSRLSITASPDNASAVKALVSARITPTTASGAARVDALKLEASEIPTGYVPRADEILPGTIRGGLDGALSMVAAGTIIGGDLLADTITAAQIAASAITVVELAAVAVTTAKIAAGAITATELAAGSVTADRMSVTSLGAISANLGTITAGTVTGATFQTSTSGARVVMDASGLRYIGSDGVVAVNVNATLGGVVLKAHTDFTKPDRTIRFIDSATGGTDVGRIAGWDNGGDSSGLYLYGEINGSRGGGVILDTQGPWNTTAGVPRAILQVAASPVTGLGYVFAQAITPAGATTSVYVLRQDGKSDFARGTEIGTRITRGILTSAAPTIDYGSGFSVTRLGTGSVRIAFSPAFVASPAIELTVEDATPVVARVTARNAGTSVDIQLWNTSTGAAADSRVHFTATGVLV